MLNCPEGFGSALSKVTANKELAVGLRQISYIIMITCSAFLFRAKMFPFIFHYFS